MGALLALVPAKNLNWGFAAAFVVVAVQLLLQHFFNIDVASAVAATFSTPDNPLTSKSVLIGAAASVWLLVAHGSDVKDNLKAQKTAEK